MPACDDCGQWPQPSLAVDAVAIRGDEVLLIRRGSEPWKGMLAFPGGFVDSGENPEDAVIRELKEELLLTEMQIGRTHAFDDIDLSSGRVFRHHVFEIITTQKPQANEGQQLGWHSNIQASKKMSPIVSRSLGALGLS